MNPSDISTRSFRRRLSEWKWPMLVACLIVVVIMMIAQLMKRTGGPGHDFVRSINNMKQIGLGLAQFDADYDSYPNGQTRALVHERHPESKIQLGTSSSNDYFHQLIASGSVYDPSCFYGYGISNRKVPEVVDSELPLPPGTCGFAYIITDGELTPPSTPLVVYPLVRGKFIFDKKLCKLWGNKAAVLHADSSVRAYPIDSSGRIMIDGLDLFDPAQAHWQGRSFQVKWPD